MEFVVIGGTCLIGSPVVEALKQKGHALLRHLQAPASIALRVKVCAKPSPARTLSSMFRTRLPSKTKAAMTFFETSNKNWPLPKEPQGCAIMSPY